MFKNLEAEMTRQSISREAIALKIGKSLSSVQRKMRGERPFTLSEAMTIKKSFFPDIAFEELWEETENKEGSN